MRVDSGFNATTVQRLTGLTHRQLSHWDKTGLIRPSLRQASGPGTRRLYSFEDLVELRVVKTLRDLGVALQAIRRSVAWLHKHRRDLERPLAQLRFVTDGRRIFSLTSSSNIGEELTANGQHAILTVAVGQIVSELDDRVVQISAPRELVVRLAGHSYRAVLTPDLEAGGYTIEVPELPGCFSEAETVQEARATTKEAITGWLTAEGRLPRRVAR